MGPGFEPLRDHLNADVAELVDALVLGTSIIRCEGSSPFIRTMPCKWRAISSVGSEHLVYTEGVGSSNLSLPTYLGSIA